MVASMYTTHLSIPSEIISDYYKRIEKNWMYFDTSMLCLWRPILFQQFNNDDDDNDNDDLLTDPLGGSSLLNYLQIKLH